MSRFGHRVQPSTPLVTKVIRTYYLVVGGVSLIVGLTIGYIL